MQRFQSGNIRIESCVFLGNKAPRGQAGAIFFNIKSNDSVKEPGCIKWEQKSPFPREVWHYNTLVTIKNTVFANNTATTGGALALSKGNYTLQNCSFIDNFAEIRGGHIYIPGTASTSLKILDSLFQQRHSSMKIQLPKKNMTFDISSFIENY